MAKKGAKLPSGNYVNRGNRQASGSGRSSSAQKGKRTASQMSTGEAAVAAADSKVAESEKPKPEPGFKEFFEERKAEKLKLATTYLQKASRYKMLHREKLNEILDLEENIAAAPSMETAAEKTLVKEMKQARNQEKEAEGEVTSE
ncbi:hypothetical protein QQX98_005057 [Neonectria punicea]|uniref:Uncharacterized protein n=1 Tax=Neonectria punicea TaxID=979145 RepID=A0ABR1H821_9HYPO